MFIDEVTIMVESGAGGDGSLSFRREKYVPRGGPDGGDGGDGGDVVLVADARLATLHDYRYHSHIKAKRGTHGKGKNLTGGRGRDALVRVPPGTLAKDAEGRVIADLVEDGTRLVLAKGGRGGRGNMRFKSSRIKAPRRADPGGVGKRLTVHLELKLLADVGLVGFPNAGKSTLLSRLSAAHPKIADYPFTTLEPHLGIVRWEEYETFVLADLPGLIEGAHGGKGLGLRFLRHIERTRMLLFVLDISEEDPQAQLEVLRGELREFDAGLLDKPFAIAFTKTDLLPPDADWQDPFEGLDGQRYRISAVSGEGLRQMTVEIGAAVQRIREEERVEAEEEDVWDETNL